MTGYDLAKRFDSSVGFFWHANHQQIYRELGVLKERTWVKGETVLQSTRPNKTIFSISKSGRGELLRWSRQTAAPAAIKEELVLKLYALTDVDVPAVVEQLKQRLELHQERLALYERILSRHYGDETALNLASKGKLLGLKAGMLLERNWIEWCVDSLGTLQEQMAPAHLAGVRPNKRPARP
jgi:DNA-binding PadR family transcriptional regulator